MTQTLAIDFNKIRIALARCMAGVIPGANGKPFVVVYAEPEMQNVPRPALPYSTFKITTLAAKSGDDTKSWVLDDMGQPTTVVNSGGVRKMSVDFDFYAQTHEDAANLAATWQTALDLEDIQAILREAGIAVWIIGGVADLSQLLNTAYEGRAHLSCQFGIAMNLRSDLGEIDSVVVSGEVSPAPGQPGIAVTQTVTQED